MATLLYRLNGADEEEAEEVRALLQANDIDFYETSQGRWGMSLAAVWLKDDSQLDEAKALLKDYEEERAHRVRKEFVEQSGFRRIVNDPVRGIAYLILILAILYISLMPFFDL